MMNTVKWLLMAMLLTTAAAVAYAEQAAPPVEKKREEIMKRIETVRIWKLTEELKLDSETAAKLSSLLSSINQQRREVLREQAATLRELRRILGTSKPDEEKLKTLLEKYEANHQAIRQLTEKEFSGLKDILTVEQQARFILFQQRFQREMRNKIHDAKGRGQNAGGPVPGAPKDR
jgi:Spy/CpxP family protein refolding chaperone